jgi:hypothetical protein
MSAVNMDFTFRMALLKLALVALTVSVCANGQVATHDDVPDVLGRARSSYYNLTRKGFKGFTATVEPNWEIILASSATSENLKVFRDVKFSMVVDGNGVVTVRHELGPNAAKPNLEPIVQKIHYDTERLIVGFFNTWRTFMVSSPFPETENPIKLENPDNQYRLVYNRQAGEVVIMMTRDFLITDWSLSGPAAKRTVKPHFEKTADGFLLTSYQGLFEPVGAGIKTTLDFTIEYQDVSGLKLPHKVQLKGMHGSEPVEAELVFTVKGE